MTKAERRRLAAVYREAAEFAQSSLEYYYWKWAVMKVDRSEHDRIYDFFGLSLEEPCGEDGILFLYFCSAMALTGDLDD